MSQFYEVQAPILFQDKLPFTMKHFTNVQSQYKYLEYANNQGISKFFNHITN